VVPESVVEIDVYVSEDHPEEAMSEVGGITELQLLEADNTSLKKELEGVKAGESTSVACGRAVAASTAAETKDGFLVKEAGTVSTQNQYHTSAGAAGEDGCCTVL
jgi:hypothetical protein